MSYYTVLGLEKEPFSTSPDPFFFYESKAHKAALCRVQIAISLRRGLSVILGDVGTGKTTLSRKLAQILKDDEKVVFQMILNPYFQNEHEFLMRLAKLFHLDLPKGVSNLELMEAIERFLFKCGVENDKTVVLLIDEAQIVPEFVFETLRILLNYETNEYKMLQLVLVGQLELLPRIRRMDNFWDRIALKYMLHPLPLEEVRRLLNYRLGKAGYNESTPLFTDEAVQAIWEHTQGYPRKLSIFCHNSLEHLVMHDNMIVDAQLVRELIDEDLRPFGADHDDRGEQVPVAL